MAARRRVVVALLLVGCGPVDLEPVEGRLVALPSRLDLGRVPAGLRVTRPLTLQNQGAHTVSWSAELDPEISMLQVAPDAGTLEPGGRVVLQVELLAESPGALAIPVRFDSDSPQTPHVPVFVLAEVTPEVLELTPEALELGPVRVGDTAEAALRVTNHAPDPVRLQVDIEEGPEGLSAVPAEALSLAAYQTATITVQLEALAPGDVAAQLVLHGDCNPSCDARVPVRAQRVESSLVCAPTAIDFGPANIGTCLRRDLACGNTAEAAVLVQSAVLDPQAGAFVPNLPALPLSLPAGEALELSVLFCPLTLDASRALLTLDVLEADVGPRRTYVAIEGRGGGPDIGTDDVVYFGGATVGATRLRTLAITNRGYEALHIEGLRIVPPDAGFSIRAVPSDAVASQTQAEVGLAFTPEAAGAAAATLIISSDDPDQPERRVRLEGEGLAPGACGARLTPDTLSVGLVDVGARAEATVELYAGDAPCRWFDPRVRGAAAFSLAPTLASGEVPPGGRQAFTLVYAPTSATDAIGETAVFSVDVPHGTPDEMQTSLLGVAADNDLVVYPASLDFQARPVGEAHTHTVFVFNVGTRTHRLTGADLVDGPASLSLSAPPRPIVSRPGETTRLDIAWHPESQETLRSTLRIESDQLPAALRVPIRGEALTEGCGHVRGTICAPHGDWSPAGVDVSVTSDGRQVEARTDERGAFFAYCLPAGPAHVAARRGHYTLSTTVQVVTGQTTDLPAGTCLSPPPASQIAVVTGAFDSVQDILTAAGVNHSIVNGTGAPPALLEDRDLLLGYDIVLLNCGFDDAHVRDPAVAANLRAFVDQGGSLYVSDLAYDAIEALAPDALELAGDDEVQDAAEQGQVYRLQAEALDPDLIRILGRPALDLALDGDFALLEAAAPTATVHLVGATSGPEAGKKPLAITYQPAGSLGRVVYTTAHESALVLDPDVRALLEYLVFSL